MAGSLQVGNRTVDGEIDVNAKHDQSQIKMI